MTQCLYSCIAVIFFSDHHRAKERDYERDKRIKVTLRKSMEHGISGQL